MLIIRCSKCKGKTIKYKKIGMGRVLRCWKDRIERFYDSEIKGANLVCGSCGNIIGEDDGDYFKMNRDAFTYTGTKIRK